MTFKQVIFYIFSFLAVLGAFRVITARNSVKALLFLVLTFVATAGLWMLLESEFLSLTLILVYVGAVMVLFLFVVMMLDVELASVHEGFTRYLPFGFSIAALIIMGLIYVVGPKNFGLKVIPMPVPKSADFSNIRELGVMLYTHFLYPFELAGVLLLSAIIAAISLTFRRRSENKAPDPQKQTKVQKKDRIKLVRMDLKKDDI
jgi:NADH-quinone oxidoreductase subunit J